VWEELSIIWVCDSPLSPLPTSDSLTKPFAPKLLFYTSLMGDFCVCVHSKHVEQEASPTRCYSWCARDERDLEASKLWCTHTQKLSDARILRPTFRAIIAARPVLRTLLQKAISILFCESRPAGLLSTQLPVLTFTFCAKVGRRSTFVKSTQLQVCDACTVIIGWSAAFMMLVVSLHCERNYGDV
jgi:hypothetical protein